MTTLSYADEQRIKNPLQYEKSRLLIDVTTELKLALEDQGINISELARQVGRGRAIVARQLSGQENLSLGKLAELAFHLGKRFEMSLVNISQSDVLHVRSRHLALVWAQRRTGSLRLSVSEPAESAPTEPAPYTTAA
jgi:hypothetical protein